MTISQDPNSILDKFVENKNISNYEHKVMVGLNCMYVDWSSACIEKDHRQNDFLKVKVNYLGMEELVKRNLTLPNDGIIFLSKKVGRLLKMHQPLPNNFGLIILRWDSGNSHNYRIIFSPTISTTEFELTVYNLFVKNNLSPIYAMFKNQDNNKIKKVGNWIY
jgi:hypothetical protein